MAKGTRTEAYPNWQDIAPEQILAQSRAMSLAGQLASLEPRQAELEARAGELLDEAKTYLAGLLPCLGRQKVEELSAVIARYHEQRFRRKRKQNKYGMLNKGFTDEQLDKFMRAIENDKYKLLFGFQSFVGLRIGEAVKVNLADIDFKTRVMRVMSEKTHRLDTPLIPIAFFEQTSRFIEAHRAEIERARGYIFFKEQDRRQRTEPYIEENYARKKFREYLVRAGLDSIYAESEESIGGRSIRKLHLLTTHSLRHYAITRFYNQTKNWMLTSRFARHIEPNTTTTYIHTDTQELYRETDKAFCVERIV